MMHVISLKVLKDFSKKHPESEQALTFVYRILEDNDFESFNDLRRALPQVDYVKPFVIFNIGRAYRLVAAVHFNRRKVYVRHILTHAEYDRGAWKRK